MAVTTPNGAVHLRNGRRVGKWIVAEFLGSGGSASVYRATVAEPADRLGALADPLPTSDVALRICRPVDERHLRAIVDTYQNMPVHPNVITVHDVFVDDFDEHRHVVCITELGRHATLVDRLNAGDPLGADETRTLAADLIGGLDAYHRAGRVHGDVKPANVMYFEDGWKLVDPSATETDYWHDATSAVVTHERTLRYVAPEVIDTPGRTRRAGDVWALGVTIHEAMTASSPFASMSDQVTARPSINPSVPTDLRRVIERCVAPLDKRCRTAGELVPVNGMVAGKRGWSGGIGGALGQPNWWSRMVPRLRSRAGALLLGAVALASVGGLVAAGAVFDVFGDEPASSTSSSQKMDFESAGSEARFVSMGSPQVSLERVADNEGFVAEVGLNNQEGTFLLVDPASGAPLIAPSEVTVGADVRMEYYGSDEFGASGPLHGVVLKTIPGTGPTSGEPDAYIVSVFVDRVGITMRIGVVAEGGAGAEIYQFREAADGHSPVGDFMLFPQEFLMEERPVGLGYWRLTAQLSAEGEGVRVDATLTSPDGDIETGQWVDTGEAAHQGEGAVGVTGGGLWSIRNRYDNVTVDLGSGP